MQIFSRGFFGLVMAGAIALSAGEVGAPTVAKILRIISTGNPGGATVNCLDSEVSAELRTLSVRLDPTSQVVWVTSEKDLARYAGSGRLIVCGQVAMLGQGAAVAIVAEDGRPAVYINSANVASAKVRLPDALVKIAKVAK